MNFPVVTEPSGSGRRAGTTSCMGSSDGGLILVRELDGRLGLEKLIDEHLWSRQAGGWSSMPAIVGCFRWSNRPITNTV